MKVSVDLHPSGNLMQYPLCPPDRMSLGTPRAIFDRKVQPESDYEKQIALTGSLNRMPTILIADDSDDTRQMFQVLLAGKGYRVLEASDGEQAVERVQPSLGIARFGTSSPEWSERHTSSEGRTEVK